MADLPELAPIPEAPEAPSRVEYGANKAEFRPKANAFMDWMVVFSQWVNDFLTYINALYDSVKVDTQTVADDKQTVENDKLVVAEDKSIVHQDRLVVENIADNISGQLPEGTISDETIGIQTTWSSNKIQSEIHNQGIQSLTTENGNITEILYQDGAKTTYTYNTDGMPLVEQYIDKDGSTIRYTYTYSWTDDGTLISMVRS